MLTFTPQQQAVILSNRRSFNHRQERITNENGPQFIGNASALPRDVWGQWDREAVQIQRDTLTLFDDLAASSQMALPIGKLVHHFQTVGDSGEVNVSLDGRGKARTDQPTIEYHGTPVPLIDSGYTYSWRQMEAASTEGYQLDAAGRDNSNRRVAEKLEDAAMYGFPTIVVGEAKSYGVLNHPNRNSRATGVTLNGASGAEWVAEMVATLKLLHSANYKVPATVYLNWDDWFYASTAEFTAGYPKTILQRISEIAGIKEIKPVMRLPANNVVALVKDRRVYQMLNAMPVVTRAKFRANPEDDYDFTVIAAAALEIKFDAEGQCGIAVSS
tara:strand:- start:2599 stop:3585 length:987 start_codon:yes stop_codon:yes gene_type:complete